jgi:hypothetical protein
VAEGKKSAVLLLISKVHFFGGGVKKRCSLEKISVSRPPLKHKEQQIADCGRGPKQTNVKDSYTELLLSMSGFSLLGKGDKDQLLHVE